MTEITPAEGFDFTEPQAHDPDVHTIRCDQKLWQRACARAHADGQDIGAAIVSMLELYAAGESLTSHPAGTRCAYVGEQIADWITSAATQLGGTNTCGHITRSAGTIFLDPTAVAYLRSLAVREDGRISETHDGSVVIWFSGRGYELHPAA